MRDTQKTIQRMRWLRLVGSLKTKVAFSKEPYKRDYILHTRPISLRSLLIIATPYPKRRYKVSSIKYQNLVQVSLERNSVYLISFSRHGRTCQFKENLEMDSTTSLPPCLNPLRLLCHFLCEIDLLGSYLRRLQQRRQRLLLQLLEFRW